ncbi:hypothetical protein PTSG_11377 [Salpingoeca rosetta]|uniref:Uncharacterized protein n=1 Tax=Salpingoeca rosetta (strain ATCC 50818 / BSB-021) TaxID=946362 RepID=F2UT87_SALR5|nr:uncharacterized protein PTSG_11377 [Salpingoeca rosetta]EGD81346.1 hypothetical protein PTSG_11377 [Salpingoeca rosetta]|eukprot:XP_004987613.1 hypothetical protein PTSG_11377 [Salpingoeca rosetta]
MLGAVEWALVADHLLNGGAWTIGVSPEKRDQLRDVLNLMLTCRSLYHNLPWAMPKWRAARGFLCRFVPHWLDTFQQDGADADAAAAAAASQWLLNRFLVYSWLGFTWESTCPFIIKLRQGEARHNLKHPLRADFQRYVRINFDSLEQLQSWLDDGELRETVKMKMEEEEEEDG